MGYRASMVHRIAEEMQRMAWSDDTERVSHDDACDILDALFSMVDVIDDDLAAHAIDVYHCRMSGEDMELPDVLDSMEDEIAKYNGCDSIESYLLDRCCIVPLKDKNGRSTGVYIDEGRI